MGNNTHESAALLKTLEHLYGSAQGIRIQRSESLVDEHAL